MTPKERRSLKENLSEHDLEALRRRYTVDIRSEIHETQPKLCGDERKRIREQVIEVHMQFMRGVPRTGGPQPLNPPSGRGEIHLGVPGGGSMGGPGGPGGMGGGPGGGPRH